VEAGKHHPGSPRLIVSRQLKAIIALVLMGASVVLAVIVAVQTFPRGLTVTACLLAAVLAAWWCLLRRRVERAVGLGAAALLLVGACLLVLFEGRPVLDALIIAGVVLSERPARGFRRTH
jgi:hypothetical protein